MSNLNAIETGNEVFTLRGIWAMSFGTLAKRGPMIDEIRVTDTRGTGRIVPIFVPSGDVREYVSVAHLDELARRYTCSDSLADLCELGKPNGYFPTLRTYSGIAGDDDSRRNLSLLADAYDAKMRDAGDKRRAFRD